MYNTNIIANTLLEIARKRDIPISPMKLQKLIYFAHGWYVAHLDKPLINEQVEVWPYGPVIPSLYHRFKMYGMSPIPKSEISSTIQEPDEENVRGLLEKILDVYGKFSAVQLSAMTHEPDAPWERVNSNYPGPIPKGTDIPLQYIKDYFKGKMATSNT